MIDRDLITRSQEGDIGAFNEMVRDLTPVAWRIAFRILTDNFAAEDIAQEVMVKLWRKLDRFNSDRCFSSWFYRIVVNCCYDELRRRKREIVSVTDERSWQILSEITRGDNGLELSVDDYELLLKVAVEKLSPKQKVVFVLSELEGMERREIMKITGMNGSSLKSNLHYARKKIKELIKGRY
ncbi:MAG: RNA polymerase sigma factor [Bacteroidales bacterium]